MAKTYAHGVELETMSDELGQAQDNLIDLSTKLTASTLEDILFKMALWRRYAPEIDPFNQAMTGDEKLGYSVFMDLALMCQREDVFSDRDTQYLLSR